MKPKTELKEEKRKSMVETYYKNISKIVEYYVILCFVLITFVPLLNYSWVAPFVHFIYYTGFPLLLLLLLFSLIKESFLNWLSRILEPELHKTEKQSDR